MRFGNGILIFEAARIGSDPGIKTLSGLIAYRSADKFEKPVKN